MTYWKRFFTDWNVCRIVRSIAGVLLLIYGIQLHEWAVIIFGIAWLAAGLFSMQCCAGGNCYTPGNNKVSATNAQIDFEEIK